MMRPLVIGALAWCLCMAGATCALGMVASNPVLIVAGFAVFALVTGLLIYLDDPEMTR